MAALLMEHEKMMKFATIVEKVIISGLTNCGVSSTNSIAPPPFQKLTILKLTTLEPFVLEQRNVVHLINFFMLITYNILH